jgi:signal transduction histidine kinase
LIQEVSEVALVDATERGVGFSATWCDVRAEVHADPQLLAGAIENIVHNALKFTPRRGQVSLTVREATSEISIDVEDACGGLSVGKLDHLFCAFEQHAGDRSGLGLGLSISNASIRAIGGRLHATDLPGKGCIFTVTLPKAP